MGRRQRAHRWDVLVVGDLVSHLLCNQKGQRHLKEKELSQFRGVFGLFWDCFFSSRSVGEPFRATGFAFAGKRRDCGAGERRGCCRIHTKGLN